MDRTGDILIAEDDRSLRRLISYTLERLGYSVTGVDNGALAADAMKDRPFDVVLTDVRMPEMDGIELLRFIKEFDPAIDVLVLTGHSSITDAVEAIKLGAYDYLEKPVHAEKLAAVIDRIFERKSLRQKADALERRERRDFEYFGMLGRSAAMNRLFQNIGRIARYNNPVLISGESGTGKELVAVALHHAGPRADRPFVAFNGAGIVDSLFESQLFGHQRGAFTGAVRDQTGLMEQADGGTLFIDEVGEISSPNQAKLLRALETMEVRPVGAGRAKRVDIRIVAATNKDLKRAMEEGRFREDLYYRLRGFTLNLVPLRERPDDIELLADFFLREARRENNLQVEGFAPKTREFFDRYPWPGNVRELRHVVATAAALTNDSLISMNDLPSDMVSRTVESGDDRAPSPLDAAPLAHNAQPPALEEMTRRHVRLVMEFAHENKSEAARILGVSRHVLYRMLKKYSL
ncbi:MAG: sigma-54 dependent transcriptional regulator [Candidatus Lernaella stagnicola]|nr:sigma-54 dependent transcriptional regulator [Candidatus Lernaella stagnicola]